MFRENLHKIFFVKQPKKRQFLGRRQRCDISVEHVLRVLQGSAQLGRIRIDSISEFSGTVRPEHGLPLAIDGRRRGRKNPGRKSNLKINSNYVKSELFSFVGNML